MPLRQHFEQQFHVDHRLRCHHAGRRVDFEDARDPDALAGAMTSELTRDINYRPVERDGAARAAEAIASLL